MEFPSTGDQCGYDLCHKLDFLPIKCYKCFKLFCNEHNIPHNHDCPAVDMSSENTLKINLKDYRYSCTFAACKKWELAPVKCSFCEQLHCLQHKHQLDHNCPKYVPPSNPMAAAAAKIEELTSKLSSSKPKKTKKNDKLAAKVQLMKLKASALGNKQLPLEERIFFLIFLPKSMSGSIPVFVSHHWTVGKVVDAIADLAKVVNNNNKITSDRLGLFQTSDGSLLTPYDLKLKQLVENKILFSGQNLILEYFPTGSVSLSDFSSYANSSFEVEQE